MTTVQNQNDLIAVYGDCGQIMLNKQEALDLAMRLFESVGWQPMETAPRDGREIIINTLHYGILVASCYKQWWKVYGDFFGNGELAGWLPLPEMKGAQE